MINQVPSRVLMILALLPGISSGWSVTLDAASGQLWELCEQPVTILEEPVSMNYVTHDRYFQHSFMYRLFQKTYQWQIVQDK